MCKCTALGWCEPCRQAFLTGPVAAEMGTALRSLEDKLVAAAFQPEPDGSIPYAGMSAWLPKDPIRFGVDRSGGTTPDSCGAFGVACNRCESCKSKAVYPVDPYATHRENTRILRGQIEGRIAELKSELAHCEDELRRMG